MILPLLNIMGAEKVYHLTSANSNLAIRQRISF